MNRRTFIHATGATSLELTGRLGLADSDAPRAALLELLEDSPRDQVPRELARRIRSGARYEDVLASLTLASVRNVQPYPDVGFKYHSVMMLRSVRQTSEHLPVEDQWLPLIWAADYFKDTQAQERAGSGWRQPARPTRPANDPKTVRLALIAALDHWDRDAADVAIAQYAQVASTDEVFSVLFPYGARDLRAIGHKAIAVSNAHFLTQALGTAQAEPLLRSTVAALLNSDSARNPASEDLPPDRPWRLNQQRLGQIPRSWKQGHDDSSARRELRAVLYESSPEDAGGIVVELLRRAVAPEAIWQTLFDTAAELLMHQPGIVPLHAQTTANALHYAYRACGDEGTQQRLLLQGAAFVAMFRQMTGATRADLDLPSLQPLAVDHTGAAALTEIFSELSAGRRLQAARKSLGYLQGGGDEQGLVAAARRYLVEGAEEAHDYKFSAAVFESHAQSVDVAWRARFLSAGMAYFKAPAKRPVEIIAEARELLRS